MVERGKHGEVLKKGRRRRMKQIGFVFTAHLAHINLAVCCINNVKLIVE